MATIQDRITVTFYGDDDVMLSNKFRKKLQESNKSINEKIKELVREYVEKQ